ncbi:MAG: hypothetical protein LUG49_06900 [Oscillospiraceae bacterium]|nr:hypothetical protein [Oscillospiraceae bacterium]
MKSRKILSLIVAFVMMFELLPASLSASYTGEDALSGINLEVYRKLKAAVERIADGTVSSTIVTIDVTCDTASLGVARITDDRTMTEAVDAFSEALDYNLVLSYLIYSCPYELCWMDKSSSVYTEQKSAGEGNTLNVSLTIYLPVATAYQAEGSFTVDSSKISLAQTAAAYAQSVVKKYSGYSDEEKLVAFKDVICSLVSYETNYSGSDYGDIWQLVYVFDQDDSTNVVCEGYAKAFQYLCDLAGIDCITVTGVMSGGTGAGAHMWNVVRLDGVNYLVDLTNSDTDSIGQNGELFMVCASDAESSDSSGYTFIINSNTVIYTYDKLMLTLYPESYLTLGNSNKTTDDTTVEISDEIVEEVEEVHTHTLTRTKARDATCTEEGNIEYWYCSGCDTYFSDKNATTEITLSDTVTEATGHNYVATVTAPTCTENGYTVHTCSNCGDSYVDNETEATGHNYEEFVVAPTCTENGYTTHTCSNCGDSYADSETEAFGHTYFGSTPVFTGTANYRTATVTRACLTCGEELTTLASEYLEESVKKIVRAVLRMGTEFLM